MATRDIRNHARPAVDHQHDPIDTVPSVRQHAHQVSPPQQPAAPAIQLPHNWSMEKVDDAQRKILLEQAWSGVEFKKREPRSSKLKEPLHATGAFKMWGPSLAGVPGLNVPARLPYTTYSRARFNSFLAKEEELRDEAEVKHQQLIRHGLVSRASLVPILTLPEMTEVEKKRRRKAAAAQIAKYEYESSSDEEEPTGRLARLKTALKRHELPPSPPPPPPPEDAEPDTEGTSNSLKRKADETSSASDEEEQHEPKRSKLGSEEDALHNYMLPPTLNFQEATRNPSHPDFGLSFSSALELALAKQKKEVTQEGTREHWAVEGDAAEPAAEDAAEKLVENDAKATIGEAAVDASSSKAKQAIQKSSSSSEQRPKLMLKLTKKSATSTTSTSSLRTTSQQPSRAYFLPKAGRPTRITRLHVQPLYDPDSFETAVAMRELGLDFGDLRMVGWFNHQMQADQEPEEPAEGVEDDMGGA